MCLAIVSKHLVELIKIPDRTQPAQKDVPGLSFRVIIASFGVSISD
jgi:hypothetical protein